MSSATLTAQEAPMSPKENLLRLIDQLPEDRLAELERLAISMMPSSTSHGQPSEPTMSFEEAQAYVFKTFDKTLKKLAQ
jgi:hypothetical protein